MISYIGISGPEGSGKDVVCKYIQRKLENHWSIIKFADGVKKYLDDTYTDEWSTEKWESKDRSYRDVIMKSFNMTRREVIRFVAENMKKDNKDYWVNDLFEHKNQNISGNYLISDVRFINEIDGIRKRGGIIIRIDVPIQNGTEHISERELDNYDNYDDRVLNDKTLRDLFDKIDIVLENKKIK